MGLNKEKILLQAELDQSLESLREKLEDIRQLKDWLCQKPRESLTKGLLLARMCVRAIWLQLETNQCNLDEASYLENRSLMNMRKWFANPDRMKVRWYNLKDRSISCNRFSGCKLRTTTGRF